MTLYRPTRGGYGFSVSNQATPSLTPGTSITPGNNTFPTYTEILSDTVVTEDCFGILIRISGIGATGLAKNALVNIGFDPAGGTTFVTRIPNLFASNAATSLGTSPNLGIDYFFPLYTAAGTSIAAQCSVNNATVGTARVYIQLVGRPANLERMKIGEIVESFGAVTATSKGTDVTPGNTGAEGTWVQLGSNLTNDYFWWQLGAGITNTAITDQAYYFDLGRGDGSNKHTMLHNEVVRTGSTENLNSPLSCIHQYECRATVGEGIYGRGTCSGTANTSWSMIAYGMPV